MRFGSDYREEWVNSAGDAIVFRWVRASDRELFRQGIQLLSPISVYMRFKTTKREFSEAELDYLTQLDGERHFALVALADDEQTLAGVCRGIALSGEPGVADCGLIVADCMQRTGIGRALFVRLMEAAREKGYSTIVGEMFSVNTGMFHLIDGLGVDVRWELDGSDAYFSLDL